MTYPRFLRKKESLSELQKYADKLSERLNVPPVSLEARPDLKEKKLVGWFKPPNTILISQGGFCKLIIIHEFAHYLDFLRRRKAGSHDTKFHKLHRAIYRKCSDVR